MVDIVILCPLAVEYDAVFKFLDQAAARLDPVSNHEYQIGYVRGNEHKWKVALFETEPRIENLGSFTSMVIYLLRPKYVFLVGVAGGVKDVILGDLVIATKAYGYDSGKDGKNGIGNRPNVVEHPRGIIQLCKRVKKRYESQKKPFKIVLGPIASGNKVITSTNSLTFQAIKKNYNDTIAVEMEAIGFARAAFQTGVQFANIRGISDLLDNKAECDKSGIQELASERAAEFTIDLIKSLPPSHQGDEHSKRFEIRYLHKKVGWTSYRRLGKGEIRSSGSFVELKTENGSLLLEEIRHVKHISMPGDLFRNWVELEFREGDEWSTIYLSSVQPVGLGYWRGGSTDLLAYLTPFKKTISAG